MRLLRVYYPIYAPVSGRCGGCNGHRGKINCCPRAFNHGLDLFISTFSTPSSTKSFTGFIYPRYFFHYTPRPRTPNLMKNHLLPLYLQENHHPLLQHPFIELTDILFQLLFRQTVRFSSSKSHFQEEVAGSIRIFRFEVF